MRRGLAALALVGATTRVGAAGELQAPRTSNVRDVVVDIARRDGSMDDGWPPVRPGVRFGPAEAAD